MNYLFITLYILFVVPVIYYFLLKCKSQMEEENYNKNITVITVMIALIGVFIFNNTKIMSITKILKIFSTGAVLTGILAYTYTKIKKEKDKTDIFLSKYIFAIIVPILIIITIIEFIIKK